MRVIDLSMPITDGMPVYPGDPEVKVKVAHTYETHSWELRQLSMGSHTGTHVDAPSHMHPGAATLDELPLERFFGASRVVRIRTRLGRKAGGCFYLNPPAWNASTDSLRCGQRSSAVNYPKNWSGRC